MSTYILINAKHESFKKAKKNFEPRMSKECKCLNEFISVFKMTKIHLKKFHKNLLLN